MIEEIPADFAFQDGASLDYLEDGIRAVEGNMKLGLAIIAVALGKVRREKLYLSICRDFKSYLKMDRFDMDYNKALHYSIIGENWWNHRAALHDNGIKLSEHMSKIRLLTSDVNRVIEKSPLFYQRVKELSYRDLKSYIKKSVDNLNVRADAKNDAAVTATAKGLYISGEKVRGLDMGEVREQHAAGRRALVIWCDSDTDARKIRRRLESQGVK